MSKPSKIFPTLFIGNYNDASDTASLFDLGITHVLTLGDELNLKDDLIEYMHISIMDMETENIMKHFDKTFKFIEKGRNSGACLVHCAAGISRSATICIAYLMKKLKISLQDAKEMVEEARPIIFPNSGFLLQLEQYHIKLNPQLAKTVEKKVAQPPAAATSSQSVSVEISSVSISIEPQSSLPESNLTDTQATSYSGTASEPDATSADGTTPKMVEITVEKLVFSCKTCRRPLLTQDDLMPHAPSQHGISYRKLHKGNGPSAEISCSSYFLSEPLQWMGQMEENEGKICCSKCQSRVGYWKWDGMQCSCGTWVTPAIQVAKNRVDEKIAPVTILVEEGDVPLPSNEETSAPS